MAFVLILVGLSFPALLWLRSSVGSPISAGSSWSSSSSSLPPEPLSAHPWGQRSSALRSRAVVRGQDPAEAQICRKFGFQEFNSNFHFEFDSELREESESLGDIFTVAGVAERQGACLFHFGKFHFMDPFILSVSRPDAFIRHNNVLAPAPHCSQTALNYWLN